ncbi:MAG: hypothetical protein KGM24_00705 [Elusimicrobia bacterium]|nr:hypothetical protein [Elusimicrobiota bacterium]
MSGEERPPHAVLVRSPEKFSAPKVAGVLAKRAKAPALDFIPAARRAWGIAAESLPAAEAEALAAELGAAGQESVAVPASLLESPPPPEGVQKAELSGDGFDVVSGRGNVPAARLSWTRLSVLCAAAVEVRATTTVTEVKTPELGEQVARLGLSLAMGMPMLKKSEEVKRTVETRDRRLVCDLLFRDPARLLRLEAHDLDYSLLGAKKGYGAEQNFCLLLAELSARAPRALHGRGARALLGHRPVAEARYESLDDLAREERWLAALASLGAAL